ncbi:MAG: hypothetical protein KJ607_03920 [Bacteroidetes bacterium]|nr:hypothetical protein [Bacteroidota bacterium]
MSTVELRNELQNYLNRADERFLKMVFAMAREYEKSEIVGYKVDGTPITKQALKRRVKDASKRVKSGDFITQEEIEKEVENW